MIVPDRDPVFGNSLYGEEATSLSSSIFRYNSWTDAILQSLLFEWKKSVCWFLIWIRKHRKKENLFRQFFPCLSSRQAQELFFVFFQLQFLLIYSTMAQGHGIKGWLTSSDKIPSNLFFVFFPKCFSLVAFTYMRGMLYKTSVDSYYQFLPKMLKKEERFF